MPELAALATREKESIFFTLSLHGLLGFLGEGKNAKQRRDTKMSKWLKEWNIVQFQCYNS